MVLFSEVKMFHLLALGAPGPVEWIIIGVIGLLLFGKRLPEVGRSLGKGIIEFKKGLRGIDEEIEAGVQQKTPPQNTQPAAPQIAPAYRFDPYTGKPLAGPALPADAQDPRNPQTSTAQGVSPEKTGV